LIHERKGIAYISICRKTFFCANHT